MSTNNETALEIVRLACRVQLGFSPLPKDFTVQCGDLELELPKGSTRGDCEYLADDLDHVRAVELLGELCDFVEEASAIMESEGNVIESWARAGDFVYASGVAARLFVAVEAILEPRDAEVLMWGSALDRLVCLLEDQPGVSIDWDALRAERAELQEAV